MAKSKYDSVLPGLTRLTSESAPYQERIELMKKTCQTCGEVDPPEEFVCKDGGDHVIFARLGPTANAERYVGLRLEKDLLAAQEKMLNLRLEACTQILIASQEKRDEDWGRYGVKDNALRLATGDTIRVKSEPCGQVKDKEAFRLWCIANGYERQLQLWPSTMNAIVKERMLDGAPSPEGVEAFRKDSLVFTAKGREDE